MPSNATPASPARSRWSLAETQALLKTLITSADPISQTLQKLGLTEEDLPIAPSRTLTPIERVEIYAEMYFWRIRNAVAGDFVAVARLLGEKRFTDLMREYLTAHPPSHFSLRYAGSRLPDFMKTHPVSAEFPFLPDLFRFEWELLEAFDAEDHPLLTQARLAETPPEKWEGLQLQAHPSLRVIHFEWDIGAIRESLIDSAPLPEIKQKSHDLLIWRKDLDVKYREARPWEAALLRQLTAPTSFGRLCETLSANETAADSGQLIPTLSHYLSHWVTDEMLV